MCEYENGKVWGNDVIHLHPKILYIFYIHVSFLNIDVGIRRAKLTQKREISFSLLLSSEIYQHLRLIYTSFCAQFYVSVIVRFVSFSIFHVYRKKSISLKELRRNNVMIQSSYNTNCIKPNTNIRYLTAVHATAELANWQQLLWCAHKSIIHNYVYTLYVICDAIKLTRSIHYVTQIRPLHKPSQARK